jgi:hypothetical protein
VDKGVLSLLDRVDKGVLSLLDKVDRGVLLLRTRVGDMKLNWLGLNGGQFKLMFMVGN